MSTTDNTNAALRGSESNDQLGPLPEPALTHDRHGHMLLIGPCYTADQTRAYAAQERAAERERLAAACWERRGHFASDAAARAFAELVRDGLA